MRIIVFILVIISSILSNKINANASLVIIENSSITLDFSKPKPIKFRNFLEKLRSKNPKLTAAALTVTLGPFGAHRIYLGTSYSVPIFYTLTLGGGLGVLPLADLLLILFSKDLSKYYNNTHVFMWDLD